MAVVSRVRICIKYISFYLEANEVLAQQVGNPTN